MSVEGEDDKQISVVNMDGEDKAAGSGTDNKGTEEPTKRGHIFWADSSGKSLEVHHYSDRLHYSQVKADNYDEPVDNQPTANNVVPHADSGCKCCIMM